MASDDDPVLQLIEHANRMLASSPSHSAVEHLAGDLNALPDRELVRFDQVSRSWRYGFEPRAVKRLNRPLAGGARKALWGILGLLAFDGHARERAVRATELSTLTIRLLALRAIDWVAPVRLAALDRLAEAPPALLTGALSLVDQLTTERLRAAELAAVFDRRLQIEQLRTAIRAADPLIRRAAWRRLAERDATTSEDLALAAGDADVVVRGIAARGLKAGLPPAERRAIAEVLIGDHVGWVAGQALESLIALDGAPAIERALVARSPTVRRAARDWAAIRDVDARAVYLQRVEADPRDALALTALCEIADRRDVDRFRDALADRRTRVRAGALRALGRVDVPAARGAALQALEDDPSGRVQRAAAGVLRERSVSAAEIERLQRLALEHERPWGLRCRALAFLRSSTWAHLAFLLEARTVARSERERESFDDELRAWLLASTHIGRGPEPALRDRLARLLPALDEQSRARIEFILHTTV